MTGDDHSGGMLPAQFTTGPARWRGPVRHHRRPGDSSLRSRLGAVALLVAVVAAGGGVMGLRSTVDERERPFVATGAVGEAVPARVLWVTVHEVRTAAEVTDRPGWRHDTGGVWVLVRIRAEAVREVSSIGYAAVRDSRGRSWRASGRISQPLVDGGYRLQPGVPVEAEIAFEVPRDAATDLALRIAGRALDLRLDAVAEVALPVDRALVDRGLAVAEPVLLAPPRVVLDPPAAAGADRRAGR